MTHKKKKNIYSLYVSKKAINKNGLFTTLLGKQLDFPIDPTIIGGDSRLIYDYKDKTFYLSFPTYDNKKIINNRKDICALDPGEKIFMAYYGLESYGMIGNDIRKKILFYEMIIRKLNSNLKNKININGKKLKNKYKLKNKINKYHRKIKNIVKELHNKTALYLCKNYKIILLPKFETQKMLQDNKIKVKNKVKENIEALKDDKVKQKLYSRKVRLNKRVKYVLNQLSHYKFKQHLINKCAEYGCKIDIVTEEYTSRLCSKCWSCSDQYTNRMKKCVECKYKIKKDHLKNYFKYLFIQVKEHIDTHK